MKKVYIKTYGCQMNNYDSIRMQSLFEINGYQVAANPSDADVVVFNTCHIREKASQKLYSDLGRIKQDSEERKENPIIVVAGCVGQAEGEEVFTRAPFVNVVVGPQSYCDLPNLVAEARAGKQRLASLDFIDQKKFDNLPEESSLQGISSFVAIQEGCDKFCTFCVVPYTRGAEFSRPVAKVYDEVVRAVDLGAVEVILLGQNVSAYHGLWPDGSVARLEDLVSKLAEIKGLERIRYTTSHPIDISDQLCSLHGSEKKLMPFLHLPFQSGSNKVLRDMNRKHTVQHYLDIISKMRAARPDIAFSSDIIVGFPGEDEEDFDATLKLVEKVGFAQCYSFKYSPRPGTPAYVRPQVPEKIKDERLQTLQALLRSQQFSFNESFVNKEVEVLFEKAAPDGKSMWGKSQYFQSVCVEAGEDVVGNIIRVEVEGAGLNSLTGRLS